MSAPNLCTALSAELGELFRCSPHGSYQRIRTPYLYPDGDNIDIFCKEQGSGLITVTDLAESVRWLRMQSMSPKRSTKQRQLIEDTCLTHGVEFYRGCQGRRRLPARRKPVHREAVVTTGRIRRSPVGGRVGGEAAGSLTAPPTPQTPLRGVLLC
jgi:hypothetical protein